jgi:alkanesulfonate monooxygenase SsuD/methylene tetrahydromethanopterin reductase-like flavin-dependent oxidoreductase (luciferase family)
MRGLDADPAGAWRDHGRRFEVGICLGSIGVSYAWFEESAQRLEDAGYDTIWCWDHFISRGDRRDPVLEAWTTLTAVAARTDRVRLGTFVANVMNRHPAVLARMASTFQEMSGGRLVLGIGIGGHPAEHEAMGIPFPAAAERVARLEDGVGAIRALWRGGPVSRESSYYPLHDAHAFPRPIPHPPIIVGGETPRGARLAARIGDGWTAFAETFERDEPLFREELATAGRQRSDTLALVAFALPRGQSLADSPWVTDRAAAIETWRARGADGAIITARTSEDVEALVRARGAS